MVTITAGEGPLTLINVFRVTPDRQRELLDVLTAATHETMRHVPGFVSASLHVSGDGARVVNYAQWESRGAFDAMLARDDVRPHMKRAAELAESYDPILCTVAESVGRV